MDTPPLGTPLAECLQILVDLPITEEDRTNIFRGNAERLFGLAPLDGAKPGDA